MLILFVKMSEERTDNLKNTDIMLITADTRNVEIDRNEMAQRLGTKRHFEDDLIRKCTQNLMNLIRYKCAYIRVPVDMQTEYVCDFGFMRVKSINLYKNLQGCREVFAMALTAGLAVDRELAKLRIVSQAEYFVTDAIASAAIDSFADYAVQKMKGNLRCCPRFSPGYGDFALHFQQPFLERLSAQALLGITLDQSFLMSPMKSITAIMGIKQ